ncbi:MAG: Ig-like domain-containing protein [Gordonia sp. (in: high G+C Gram-positive bacteria)]|jgi:hypothetical protein|nr:Ig-like domain-containing protein [Gordonia sp. (in: high G+C Gram-positive bacteria)]
MFSRKSAATVATIATAVGSMVAFAPASPASAAPTTTTTSFTHSCKVDGNTDWDRTVNDAVETTAPATVAPGETFDIVMQSGAIQAEEWTIGRLKYDFKVPSVPAGGEILSAELVPDTGVNLLGETPTLFRVNDAGGVDANGAYYRVAGSSHKTIRNGPNSNDNDPETGLRGYVSAAWRTPKLKITLKAPSTVGGTFTTGIRAGAASAAVKIEDTSLSYGDKRSFLKGGVTAHYCVATGDGRGVFTTTTVAKNGTTVALDAPNEAGIGQEVTLTANVSPNSATGAVQFKDGDDDLGAPVAVNNGVATKDHTFTTRGNHDIKAVFVGSGTYADATSTVKTVSVKSATTTTLTAPTTARVGEDVEFVATVSPDEATGTIQFKEGATDLGAPMPVVNGKATITRKYDEAGSHTVKAVFNASGHFADSEADAKTVTVKDADFTTGAVVVDPMNAVTGESTALRATVRPIPDGGKVEFFVNGDSVGQADVGTADGVAVLSHTFTAAGTAEVTAKFLGHEGFAPSEVSAPRSVTVRNPDTRADTSTKLAVQGAPNVGKTVTFTATVTPGTAGGKVQFRAGTQEIGAPVDVVNGVATLTHAFNEEGTYAVTAEYLGDNNNRASESGPTIIKVTTASNPVDPGGNGSLSNIFGS